MRTDYRDIENRILAHDPPHMCSADAADGEELLALLLRICGVRLKADLISQSLIERFGSFPAVVSAEPSLLTKENGISRRTAVNLRTIYASTRRIGASTIRDRRIKITGIDVLRTYCLTNLAYEKNEQFRVIYLSKQDRLIRDELHQRGTIDYTVCYPREIVKRACELSATAIITLNNRPSRSLTPTVPEISTIRHIDEITKSVGILLLDHVIVSPSEIISMKERSLF